VKEANEAKKMEATSEEKYEGRGEKGRGKRWRERRKRGSGMKDRVDRMETLMAEVLGKIKCESALLRP
jgi:hypothetical protein